MTRPRQFRRHRLLCFAVSALAHTIAQGCDLERWDREVSEASGRFSVERSVIRAVMRVESNGCEQFAGTPTTSSAGAMGLMQLMPGTWDLYRRRLGLGADPYDARDNILAGTAYLRDLMADEGLLDALAAYFAGPRHRDGVESGMTEPSSATLRYVHDVLSVLLSDDAIARRRGLVLQQGGAPLLSIQSKIDGPVIHGESAPGKSIFAIMHGRTDDVRMGGSSAKPVQDFR